MNQDYIMKDIIRHNLFEMQEILAAFNTEENIAKIASAAEIMTEAIKNGSQIISCGNGGSLCDATHFAEELTARFRHNRQALPAIAINDPAYLSCVSNDFGFQYTVSRFIEAIGKKGDILLAISTSGNSDNIVLGARVAKKKGIKVIALTGKDGGKLASVCDVEIRAPKSDYSDRVQEIHIKVIHTFVQLIEAGMHIEK